MPIRVAWLHRGHCCCPISPDLSSARTNTIVHCRGTIWQGTHDAHATRSSSVRSPRRHPSLTHAERRSISQNRLDIPGERRVHERPLARPDDLCGLAHQDLQKTEIVVCSQPCIPQYEIRVVDCTVTYGRGAPPSPNRTLSGCAQTMRGTRPRSEQRTLSQPPEQNVQPTARDGSGRRAQCTTR